MQFDEDISSWTYAGLENHSEKTVIDTAAKSPEFSFYSLILVKDKLWYTSFLKLVFQNLYRLYEIFYHDIQRSISNRGVQRN